MSSKHVILYFHVHQPFRLNNYYSPYDFVNVGGPLQPNGLDYFGGPPTKDNETIMRRVATLCYRPAGELMLDLINNHGLKVAYSFTGTLLEQWEMYAPDLLDLYREIYATGNMDLVCETYYHSLAAFYDVDEFKRQIYKQCDNLEQIFGDKPQIFRNTELTYRNDVGRIIADLGFKAMFTEGWDPVLDWRSPNYMYRNLPSKPGILNFESEFENEPEHELKLLLKNYHRSDDVAFRFQLKGWEGYPVTADKFASWLNNEPGYLINLAMDYETIGEHHSIESGLFDFYRYLPQELAKKNIEFILPSEAAERFPAEEPLDYPQIVSWADAERDLSAWRGNIMQQKSLEAVYKLGEELHQKLDELGESSSPSLSAILLDTWGKLQTSDHFYYMSTKFWSDGDVHKYFSPYQTPYQAYGNFINTLNDFRWQLSKMPY